jgi:multidrug efflux pump subunit AcrB
MKSLIHYFISRSFVVNVISAFFIIAGITLGSMIKRDTIPPFEFKSINVSINLPGATATEVEKYLAYPIEKALQGLPYSTELSTTSSSGRFEAQVFFSAGYDEIDESVEQIRGRITGISWQLPEQARDVVVEQRKVTEVFHMNIALEGFDETVPLHRQLAKKIIDQLQSIPGIVRVADEMNQQNVYIEMDPEAITRNEISIAEVRARIREALQYSPIGQVDFDERTYSVEVERPAEALETFNSLAIRGNSTGDVLYLKDLAKISLKIDEIKEHTRLNGQPVIKLWTFKDTTSDSITLKGEVVKVMDQFRSELPPGEGLGIKILSDGPKFIQHQLNTLTYNGLFGMVLVLLILTLFFNWKVSLAASFGIPIAYCGTLIALYAFGISIDIISVVGMILVLGILVDDAIIIAERYIENLEIGMKPKEAAYAASSDLMLPVTGTVLTTIFAFTPMVLIESEIAMIFYAVPIVIITSLAMSWFESFFILPNHMQHFIKTVPKHTTETSFFLRTKRLYQSILGQILRFRYLAVLSLLVFFIVSGWVAKNKIQQQFWFSANRERISVKITLKESVSLAQTERVIKPIENYLMTLPKEAIQDVSASIGQMWTHGRNYQGYRYAKILLHINDELTHPGVVKREYTKKLKKYFKENRPPEIEKLVVGHEMNEQDEKKKDMVTLEVIGNEDVDYLDLKNLIQSQIQEQKMDISLVKEVNDFDDKWVFSPDSKKLARHEMSLNQITSQLRSFFVPDELMQTRMNGESKWIYTQVRRDQAVTQAELNKLTVLNSRGLAVPLNTLGTWSRKKQLARIQHKDGKRQFTFDLAYEPSETMNVTKAKELGNQIVKALVTQFPTYSIELKDADRAEANSRAWALKVALLCIILVMFTLSLVLGSLTLPFIVGLPIPFGLMGIVWALYLHDMPMGIMSLIGLIGTVGVSVNDSLIMVDQIMKRGLKNGGLSRQHIIEGASSRLRAIILTTVTTLGGVFPMAYAIGGESGFTEPLAFSLGWGLFFSTFLTLFALPAFIEIRRDFGRGFGQLKKRFRFTASIPNKEGVDPLWDDPKVVRPAWEEPKKKEQPHSAHSSEGRSPQHGPELF